MVFILFSLLLLSGCYGVNTDAEKSTTLVLETSNSIPTESVIVEFSNIRPTITIDKLTTDSLTSSSPTLVFDDRCKKPNENYERIQRNGHTLSFRTVEMLEYAYSIYGGEIDIRGSAITQGHYTSTEPLSFGTHDGGGAVDISVINYSNWEVLYGEIEPLIEALRVAGFAAWLRDFDELSPGSPIHIHAVAIGDKELSEAAANQLSGTNGYFAGYNGLDSNPRDDFLDRHGGPVICSWMIDFGYAAMSSDK